MRFLERRNSHKKHSSSEPYRRRFPWDICQNLEPWKSSKLFSACTPQPLRLSRFTSITWKEQEFLTRHTRRRDVVRGWTGTEQLSVRRMSLFASLTLKRWTLPSHRPRECVSSWLLTWSYTVTQRSRSEA